jgi:hydroxymethylbilane synthase
MRKRKWIVGSRQSALALTQTQQVLQQLQTVSISHGFDYDFEIRPIVTKGDQVIDISLSKIGGKGLFVKEIEQSLLDRETDFAIHSMKDMPSINPDGLTIACIPLREDPRDAWISSRGTSLQDEPQGALIGTSSLRRACQLLAYRGDLTIHPLRGNIDTRLKKMDHSKFNGIVLAAAGLRRMGWEQRITELIPIEICLPAVGQGALALQCREDEYELIEFLQLIHHEHTAIAVTAERAFLNMLQGGCQIPIGGYATVEQTSSSEQRIILTGMVGSLDGRTILKQQCIGTQARDLGVQLGVKLLKQGAEQILAQAKADAQDE